MLRCTYQITGGNSHLLLTSWWITYYTRYDLHFNFSISILNSFKTSSHVFEDQNKYYTNVYKNTSQGAYVR